MSAAPGRHGRGTVLTPAAIQDIVGGYRAGVSLRALGRKHDVTHEAVRLHLIKLGEIARGRGRPRKSVDR